MSAFALSLLLHLGVTSVMGPPVLPPEHQPQSPPEAPAEQPSAQPPTEQPPVEQPPVEQQPAELPAELQPVEFPLGPSSDPRSDDTLPRMEPAPTRQADRRSIVDLRDPFNRPPVRPRPPGEHALAQQRLLMPDLKDPFAEGTRVVRSRTLDLHVPSDLRDPFRDGLGRRRAPTCGRTTGDGTVVQSPGAAREEPCTTGSAELDLHDPFRPAN